MKATAIRDCRYSPIIQPISGYVLGNEKKQVWRVKLSVGRSSFLSEAEYASRETAQKVAKRINAKAMELAEQESGR